LGDIKFAEWKWKQANGFAEDRVETDDDVDDDDDDDDDGDDSVDSSRPERRRRRRDPNDDIKYATELVGECFSLGSNNDMLVELQIASLEKLAELHEAVGQGQTAAELTKRALNLRAFLGDQQGKGEIAAKIALKSAQESTMAGVGGSDSKSGSVFMD
jgi:hypothetical protein